MADQTYRALVVDSGPIIRLAGNSTLWNKAEKYYTVPAVLEEIRDAKARQHLASLPFELQARQPSQEGIQAIVSFSKKTGDYQSLSAVDIQVLALLYDLEREGCGDMNHIRSEPKRMLGVGKTTNLGKGEEKKDIEVEEVQSDSDEDEYEVYESVAQSTSEASPTQPVQPKTWAALVNPEQGSNALPSVEEARLGLQQLELVDDAEDGEVAGDAGQFSDADDDELLEAAKHESVDEQSEVIERELQTDFPSLHAASTVPYEGSDDEGTGNETLQQREAELEERKKKSLQPVSNSGKLYNSFRKYGKLMQPKVVKKATVEDEVVDAETPDAPASGEPEESSPKEVQSRIMGGSAFAGQDGDVEDDGEGWISTTNDIHLMKSTGALDPTKKFIGASQVKSTPSQKGPAISERTACTTTDFAMQNVILQMGLELLSVDGVKLRKLKSWVQRCGACFKVYTSSDNTGPLEKRLFCERCGSDMIQRIAASVDGKTGRLKLHLAKNYKHNLRGTKFSLPKPGSGNRFQGDLLLREDQLMMGAWHQKAKMLSGGKAKHDAQSIFGNDIASNVGCHTRSSTIDDIKVGFGRRNPNAVKGRERRGKKKKSSNKACGLRRY